MSNPKWDEQILVVNRAAIFDGEKDVFQGISIDDAKIAAIGTRFDDYSVMRRGNANDSTPKESNAEINFDYKQPIPYIVFRRKGDELFLYKRLSGGGENRLFDKLSIGAGGHMNKIEGIDGFGELVWENMLREIEEELDVDSSIQFVTLGLINDDSDDVGRVHIGIVVVAHLTEEDGDIRVKETDQLQGEWMTIGQLKEPNTFAKLENWSRIVLSVLK